MKLPPKNDLNQFACTTTTEYLTRDDLLDEIDYLKQQLKKKSRHVVILIITRKDYSTEVGIYSTKENALAALFDYVKMWWEEFELEPQLGKIPENRQKAIKKYFDFMGHSPFAEVVNTTIESYYCKTLTVDASKRKQIDW
jgi:hypothetical protein